MEDDCLSRATNPSSAASCDGGFGCACGRHGRGSDQRRKAVIGIVQALQKVDNTLVGSEQACRQWLPRGLRDFDQARVARDLPAITPPHDGSSNSVSAGANVPERDAKNPPAPARTTRRCRYRELHGRAQKAECPAPNLESPIRVLGGVHQSREAEPSLPRVRQVSIRWEARWPVGPAS